MFSSSDHLAHKTPTGSLNRLEYLQQLVTEFQTSQDHEAQHQVIANLANFAYDPINYEYMRQLNVIELFLDMLTEPDETLVQFGMGGLCNLALDKENKEHILTNDGVELITDCLSSMSTNEATRLSAITTLMFLVTPESKPNITAPHVIQCIQRFAESSSQRLSNLANIFLKDYCTKDQQENAKILSSTETVCSSDRIPTIEDIPLPSGLPPVHQLTSRPESQDPHFTSGTRLPSDPHPSSEPQSSSVPNPSSSPVSPAPHLTSGTSLTTLDPHLSIDSHLTSGPSSQDLHLTSGPAS